MENISTELALALAALVAVLGASAKEIIKAGTQRMKRNILKRKIDLSAHPIFAELKIYITSQLPTWRFRHTIRRDLIVDFESVRWDSRLLFIKSIIGLNNLDTLAPHELKDKLIQLSVDANNRTRQQLLDTGFPLRVFQKFLGSTQVVENAMYSSLNSIFDSNVVFDSNRERTWAFLDQYISLFRQFKNNTLVALADLNGELSDVSYETMNYQPKGL